MGYGQFHSFYKNDDVDDEEEKGKTVGENELEYYNEANGIVKNFNQKSVVCFKNLVCMHFGKAVINVFVKNVIKKSDIDKIKCII